MIAPTIEITAYDKQTHTCEAKLLNGDIIRLDPFFDCTIDLACDGEGRESECYLLVGNKYLLTEYTVYHDIVVVHDGGITYINK